MTKLQVMNMEKKLDREERALTVVNEEKEGRSGRVTRKI